MVKRVVFMIVGLAVVSLVLLGLNGNITGNAFAYNILKRSCTDSDGGKEPGVAGVAEVKSLASVKFQEFADTCKNQRIVLEHYCDDYKHLRETINCPNGCKDGACLPLR